MKLKSKMNYLKAKPIYILYIKPGKSGKIIKYMKSYDDKFYYFNGWTDNHMPNEHIKFVYHDSPVWYGGREKYNFSYDGYDFYGPVGIFYVVNDNCISIPKDVAKRWKMELCRHNNKKRMGKQLPIFTPTGNFHETIYENPNSETELIEKMFKEYIDEYGW